MAVFTQSLIGVTFLLSALSKVGSRDGLRAFAATLVRLRLTRDGRPALAMAALIGSTEAAVSVAVLPLGPAVIRAALLLAIVLLVAFSAVIARTLRRHETVVCRCFGSSEPLSGTHLARNGALLLAASAGVIMAGQPATAWQWWLIAATAGATCAWVISRLDDVVSLFKTAYDS